jgi:SAM-dependent methyltransferase
MPANFDPVAAWYRYLERLGFGGALWRRRVAYLPELRGARRVLMAGEGDGRFLRAFLDSNPYAAVTYVDASARMLALARRRAGGERVQYLQRDLSVGEPLGGEFDAIVTHFLLDCFGQDEVTEVVRRLGRAPVWVVSEFQAPHWAARAVVSALYAFFGWTTGLRVTRLPDYAPALRAAGYVLAERQEAWGRLLVSELWRRRDKVE